MPAIDRYTKSVLTVIAGCLVWLCLRGTASLPVASAQMAGNVQDVRIVAIQKPQQDKNWNPVNVFTVNAR